MASVKALLWLLGAVLLVPSCRVPVGSDTTSASATASSSSISGTSTGTSTTTTGTTSTTTTSTTTETETDTDTEGCSFLLCGDHGGGDDIECDVWAQDCPVGEKCMPWANDGGSAWNALKCTPVGPDLPGEPCMVEGSGVSGVDSCEKGALCWDVDGETNEGICIAQCQGSAMMPSCPQGSYCRIYADAVLTLCLPTCDPLLQDCPGDYLCIPNGEGFICTVDASGDAGLYGDPCEYVNTCKPGLYCLNPEYVEDCKSKGCCTPWCDTTEPLMCPGDAQECIPWYAEGMAPDGYENVGICGIPQ